MESKRHKKLYDHYKTVFGEEPIFSLKLKKNVLPTDMKPMPDKNKTNRGLTAYF